MNLHRVRQHKNVCRPPPPPPAQIQEQEKQQCSGSERKRMEERLNQLFKRTDRSLDEFQIITTKELGIGTYGKVTLVKDKVSNELFAMKTVKQSNTLNLKDKQIRIALNREIKIQKKLDHENIIKLYYTFEDRDFIHMILEYASQGSIFKLLKSKMAEEQICNGLHYLHSNNVIHRDLKASKFNLSHNNQPENILIDEEDQIKLADFGWSTEIESQFSKRDTICGTIEYMAPEIFISKEGYTNRIDVWALGVILYEMLNGSVPFKEQDIKKQQINSENEPIVMLNSEISSQAADLIEQLLKFNPKERINIPDILKHPWIKEMAQGNHYIFFFNAIFKQKQHSLIL